MPERDAKEEVPLTHAEFAEKDGKGELKDGPQKNRKVKVFTHAEFAAKGLGEEKKKDEEE